MSRTPRIIASSGGFVSTPGLWGVMRPGGIMLEALRLTGRDRPRVLLILTASGDDHMYLSTMYSALSESSCDVDHLALFTQPNRSVDEAIGRADLIWVGGGSVANLLALWQLHGLAVPLRDAWERGTVLGGVSAGSICWHVGGPTDSFGPQLQVVTNGLGFLPYGNGVHYDSEAQRRPLLQQVVGDGLLPTSSRPTTTSACCTRASSPRPSSPTPRRRRPMGRPPTASSGSPARSRRPGWR